MPISDAHGNLLCFNGAQPLAAHRSGYCSDTPLAAQGRSMPQDHSNYAWLQVRSMRAWIWASTNMTAQRCIPH